ncbi:uncharacterized protein JCM10292_003489 [Rhodotorula paludigena]|uniref:uncharacterized protein n=1 Tax=Rhodotorula paludigena TaxID=86838 RepID=UPI003172E718
MGVDGFTQLAVTTESLEALPVQGKGPRAQGEALGAEVAAKGVHYLLVDGTSLVGGIKSKYEQKLLKGPLRKILAPDHPALHAQSAKYLHDLLQPVLRRCRHVSLVVCFDGLERPSLKRTEVLKRDTAFFASVFAAYDKAVKKAQRKGMDKVERLEGLRQLPGFTSSGSSEQSPGWTGGIAATGVEALSASSSPSAKWLRAHATLVDAPQEADPFIASLAGRLAGLPAECPPPSLAHLISPTLPLGKVDHSKLITLLGPGLVIDTPDTVVTLSNDADVHLASTSATSRFAISLPRTKRGAQLYRFDRLAFEQWLGIEAQPHMRANMALSLGQDYFIGGIKGLGPVKLAQEDGIVRDFIQVNWMEAVDHDRTEAEALFDRYRLELAKQRLALSEAMTAHQWACSCAIFLGVYNSEGILRIDLAREAHAQVLSARSAGSTPPQPSPPSTSTSAASARPPAAPSCQPPPRQRTHNLRVSPQSALEFKLRQRARPPREGPVDPVLQRVYRRAHKLGVQHRTFAGSPLAALDSLISTQSAAPPGPARPRQPPQPRAPRTQGVQTPGVQQKRVEKAAKKELGGSSTTAPSSRSKDRLVNSAPTRSIALHLSTAFRETALRQVAELALALLRPLYSLAIPSLVSASLSRRQQFLPFSDSTIRLYEDPENITKLTQKLLAKLIDCKPPKSSKRYSAVQQAYGELGANSTAQEIELWWSKRATSGQDADEFDGLLPQDRTAVQHVKLVLALPNTINNLLSAPLLRDAFDELVQQYSTSLYVAQQARPRQTMLEVVTRFFSEPDRVIQTMRDLVAAHAGQLDIMLTENDLAPFACSASDLPTLAAFLCSSCDRAFTRIVDIVHDLVLAAPLSAARALSVAEHVMADVAARVRLVLSSVTAFSNVDLDRVSDALSRASTILFLHVAQLSTMAVALAAGRSYDDAHAPPSRKSGGPAIQGQDSAWRDARHERIAPRATLGHSPSALHAYDQSHSGSRYKTGWAWKERERHVEEAIAAALDAAHGWEWGRRAEVMRSGPSEDQRSKEGEVVDGGRDEDEQEGEGKDDDDDEEEDEDKSQGASKSSARVRGAARKAPAASLRAALEGNAKTATSSSSASSSLLSSSAAVHLVDLLRHRLADVPAPKGQPLADCLKYSSSKLFIEWAPQHLPFTSTSFSIVLGDVLSRIDNYRAALMSFKTEVLPRLSSDQTFAGLDRDHRTRWRSIANMSSTFFARGDDQSFDRHADLYRTLEQAVTVICTTCAPAPSASTRKTSTLSDAAQQARVPWMHRVFQALPRSIVPAGHFTFDDTTLVVQHLRIDLCSRSFLDKVYGATSVPSPLTVGRLLTDLSTTDKQDKKHLAQLTTPQLQITNFLDSKVLRRVISLHVLPSPCRPVKMQLPDIPRLSAGSVATLEKARAALGLETKGSGAFDSGTTFIGIDEGKRYPFAATAHEVTGEDPVGGRVPGAQSRAVLVGSGFFAAEQSRSAAAQAQRTSEGKEIWRPLASGLSPSTRRLARLGAVAFDTLVPPPSAALAVSRKVVIAIGDSGQSLYTHGQHGPDKAGQITKHFVQHARSRPDISITTVIVSESRSSTVCPRPECRAKSPALLKEYHVAQGQTLAKNTFKRVLFHPECSRTYHRDLAAASNIAQIAYTLLKTGEHLFSEDFARKRGLEWAPKGN